MTGVKPAQIPRHNQSQPAGILIIPVGLIDFNSFSSEILQGSVEGFFLKVESELSVDLERAAWTVWIKFGF